MNHTSDTLEAIAARLLARQQRAAADAAARGLHPVPLYGPRARKAARQTELRREWARLAARQSWSAK